MRRLHELTMPGEWPLRLMCRVVMSVALWVDYRMTAKAEGQPLVPWVVEDPGNLKSVVFKDMLLNINFTLKVKGNETECEGWYRDIGRGRWEKEGSKFRCTLQTPGRDLNIFRLTIKHPTVQNIGKFAVFFKNKGGLKFYSFEITEDKDVTLSDYVIVTAISAGSIVIVAIVVAVVCRKRSCKRKRKNLQNDATPNETSTASPDTGTLTMTPTETEDAPRTCSYSSRKPVPPPKPRHLSLRHCEPGTAPPGADTNPVACYSGSSSSGALSDPCVCGPSTMHGGYVRMDGSNKFIYAQRAQLAEAITCALRGFESRARTDTGDSNLSKNRRISRSVPSLLAAYSSGRNHGTLRSMSTRHNPKPLSDRRNPNRPPNAGSLSRRQGACPQSPGNVSGLSSDRDRHGLGGSSNSACSSSFRDHEQEEFARGGVSMVTLEEDALDSSGFNSRRKGSGREDVGCNRFLRPSLEINSHELRASDTLSQYPAVPAQETAAGDRQSEHKYVTMDSIDHGRDPLSRQTSRQDPAPRPVQPPLPLPPLPPPPQYPHDEPLYQNTANAFNVYDEAEDLDSRCT